MTTRIGFVLFPRLTQLDLTGPYEVFGRLPDAQVLLLGSAARSDTGLRLQPDATFDGAPQLDVLCVPGGPGVNGAMEDEALLSFLRRQSQHASWVTSVCTGALVLGAAGLLQGYRATTHWLSLDLLPRFGAIPVRERVVLDRNRATGGGVTAGIDFGLRLAAELRGEKVAKEIQLLMEYDPAPPYRAGSPAGAGPELVASLAAARQSVNDERVRIVERAAARLGRA
ncbi:MAG TPA: DJ-1/PfpI family protein [Myxococcales bacterium]|nr:DJ-1/PfpI family protein [Myxococcales bacterium]